MKHKELTEMLEEVYDKIHIEVEYEPVSIPIHAGRIKDHYRTFLGDSAVTSNVIGTDCEEFFGVPIPICDYDEF